MSDCTCQPKPSGEAPDQPDESCPVHGANIDPSPHQTKRCPTCGSDDPRFVLAQKPNAGKLDGTGRRIPTDTRRYLWFDASILNDPYNKHWHCPDPFHSDPVPNPPQQQDEGKRVVPEFSLGAELTDMAHIVSLRPLTSAEGERAVDVLLQAVSELQRLQEERDRMDEALHDRNTWTFDTLLYVADRLLGEFYPDDIFPDVPEEDAKGDPGPQLIRAIRRCRRALSPTSDPEGRP